MSSNSQKPKWLKIDRREAEKRDEIICVNICAVALLSRLLYSINTMLTFCCCIFCLEKKRQFCETFTSQKKKLDKSLEMKSNFYAFKDTRAENEVVWMAHACWYRTHAYRTKVANDMRVKGAKIDIYHEKINWLEIC